MRGVGPDIAPSCQSLLRRWSSLRTVRYNVGFFQLRPDWCGYATFRSKPINRTQVHQMKIAQEVRAGNVIMVGKDPMVVQKAEFTKSGRNASVVKMKLKNLLS